MTKDDKVFGTIFFLFSRLHKKKLLSLGKSYLIYEESANVSKCTILYEQVNSGLYYGNLDFNFNVYAEKPCLI